MLVDLWSLLLPSAPLIAAVILIRATLLHKLPKWVFIVLWSVAAWRLLLPIPVESPISIHSITDGLTSWHESRVSSSSGSGLNTTDAIADNSILPPLDEAADSPALSFAVIRMIGAAALALFILGTHLRCRREYGTALPVTHELVRNWMLEHPLRRRFEIRQSDQIASPLTYGIMKPVILLPKQLDWDNKMILNQILSHEWVHIRRFDTLKKAVLAAVLCMHWFNPLVWVMYALANRDLELSCDEQVVRTMGTTMKSSYARTLVGFEETRSRFAPLANHFSKNAIEERIVSIMKFKKASIAAIVCSIALIAGTTAVFATNAADNNTSKSTTLDSHSAIEEGSGTNAGPHEASENDNGATELPATSENDGKIAGKSETSEKAEETNGLPEASSSAETANSSASSENSGESIAEAYAVYEPYGLIYNEKENVLYFKKKRVGSFLDILSTNGKSLDSGDFSGTIREFDDPKGNIAIVAVRDYNKLDSNGYGALTLIKIVN